jgi:hypothetical protein
LAIGIARWVFGQTSRAGSRQELLGRGWVDCGVGMITGAGVALASDLGVSGRISIAALV